MSLLFKAEVDGVEWEAWEGFAEGEIIWQRDCPDCAGGLLLAPVRPCTRCKYGFLTQGDDPRSAGAEGTTGGAGASGRLKPEVGYPSHPLDP